MRRFLGVAVDLPLMGSAGSLIAVGWMTSPIGGMAAVAFVCLVGAVLLEMAKQRIPEKRDDR